MIKKIFAAVMMIALMAVTQNAYAAPEINYQVHVQDIGWMHPVAEDQVAGTEGRGKRIEAIIINCSSPIEYNAHLQDWGWQGWVSQGYIAGTVNEGRRLEGIRIRFADSTADRYDIYYRAYVQDIGWQRWVKNGQVAGTEGRGKRMEALQIRIVRKDESFGNDRYDSDRYGNDRYHHGRHRHRRGYDYYDDDDYYGYYR
ncbi:MAG: Ig domain-containing protein [Selenomonadaceae bacterium]|nr:Ig domain-containing protein [Selenomonadaceae bacterium]MBR6711839.1 Ig domain-containing protein [Selenomonadaceae bacterium]